MIQTSGGIRQGQGRHCPRVTPNDLGLGSFPHLYLGCDRVRCRNALSPALATKGRAYLILPLLLSFILHFFHELYILLRLPDLTLIASYSDQPHSFSSLQPHPSPFATGFTPIFIPLVHPTCILQRSCIHFEGHSSGKFLGFELRTSSDLFLLFF